MSYFTDTPCNYRYIIFILYLGNVYKFNLYYTHTDFDFFKDNSWSLFVDSYTPTVFTYKYY